MRPEDKLLYLCCRQNLTPAHVTQIRACTDRALDWDEVFKLAWGHGVAPLVYLNLEKSMGAGLTIPQPIVQKFKLATYQNIASKRQQSILLTQVLDALQDEEADLMVVKGMALDMLIYDENWYTASDDIDAIIRPNVTQLTEGDIERISCKLRGMEYEFFEHHDVNLNQTLPVDFDRVWNDSTPVEIHGHRLYLMSSEDMLLAVCINSCRKRYFRLRSLCDILEIIDRCTELDWGLFVSKAKQYECTEIVYTALSVAQQTVGISLPDNLLSTLGVARIKRSIIDNLIPFLLRNISLASLSYYGGTEVVGRNFGWSLLLPYATYRRGQAINKIHEAIEANRGAERAVDAIGKKRRKS